MLALIHRIGTEFGISVVVCSHLLGEIEFVAESLPHLLGGHPQDGTGGRERGAQDPDRTLEVWTQAAQPLLGFGDLVTPVVAGKRMPGSGLLAVQAQRVHDLA